VRPSFTQVRLREGYSIEEVNEFLTRVARGLVTADEVRQVQFSTVRMRAGYDEDEVDDHLDKIEAMLRRRQRDEELTVIRQAASGQQPRVLQGLHHVEVWVPDLARAIHSWGWLMAALRWQPHQQWAYGRSWRIGDTYLVIEQSPDLRQGSHDRLRAGLNHLAFHAGPRAEVDGIVAHAPAYGWRLMFADRHPYAGGPNHYAGYLENEDGFEVELVAHWA
jgi:DivIVA domain-containing protein